MADPAPPPPPRPRFASTADASTASVAHILRDGSTRIIRGLFALEPKRRRPRIGWIVLAGILVALGGAMLDGSVRELVKARLAAVLGGH